MSDLDIAELTLIDLSRVQREALERWMQICIDCSEIEIAEELRAELSAPAMELAA
jgi:hypothetical protein